MASPGSWMAGRGLELLRRHTSSGSLIPRHRWPTFAVDGDELVLGRASGYFEEPNTLGAIHAGRLLLWLRLGSSLDRLGLYFGLYLSGGALPALQSFPHVVSYPYNHRLRQLPNSTLLILDGSGGASWLLRHSVYT